MNPFAFITETVSERIPVEELQKLERDWRKVIPSRNTRYVDPQHIDLGLIERYFQVRPTIKKPAALYPTPAVVLLIVSGFGLLVTIFALHFNFLLVLFCLGGIAGSIYWFYSANEALRKYLYPLEQYLFRETISFETYNAWTNSIENKIQLTAAKRLGFNDAQDMLRSNREGGSSVAEPLIIYGFGTTKEPVPSRTKAYLFVFKKDANPSMLKDIGQNLTGQKNVALTHIVEGSEFLVDDHVEYTNMDPYPQAQGQSHYRLIRYIYFALLEDVLGVYETSVNALDLLVIPKDSTSEYFYQGVLGLRTSVEGSTMNFMLLIGQGMSPSIDTDLRLEQNSGTIEKLRKHIQKKKSLLLRTSGTELGPMKTSIDGV